MRSTLNSPSHTTHGATTDDEILKLNISGVPFQLRKLNLFSQQDQTELLCSFAALDHEDRMQICHGFYPGTGKMACHPISQVEHNWARLPSAAGGEIVETPVGGSAATSHGLNTALRALLRS
ncbi:MAG: hypothetical protein GY696_24920 [Gammaproteobacteria bacterium]|nr:hypothetical protein [Gammaproteobacteria bacterium]